MKTTTKHTPGPWQIGDGIRSADTIGINKHRPSDDPEIGEHIETIAEVLPALNGTDEADAKLIAAAPELLAALEEALRYVDHRDGPIGAKAAMAQGRAAIAKATAQ